MGSASDAEALKPLVETLKSFGVEYSAHVASAHRTPEEATEFAKGARSRGYGVLIGCAGKAAHLAGVMAGHTTLPVIGIPMKSSFMDGLDSLLSVVQMPAGVPVATVAINGAENAAILAVQMLAISDKGLEEKLVAHKQAMHDKTFKKDIL